MATLRTISLDTDKIKKRTRANEQHEIILLKLNKNKNPTFAQKGNSLIKFTYKTVKRKGNLLIIVKKWLNIKNKTMSLLNFIAYF